jgi:hypothetical protein
LYDGKQTTTNTGGIRKSLQASGAWKKKSTTPKSDEGESETNDMEEDDFLEDDEFPGKMKN